MANYQLCVIFVVLFIISSSCGYRSDIMTVNKVFGSYSEDIQLNLNSVTEYIISFPIMDITNPYRIFASSFNSHVDFPVLIVVRQERRVTSWQIPLLVHTTGGLQEYRNTSRTLCYDNNESIQNFYKKKLFNKKAVSRNFTISISTASIQNITVNIRADPQKEYFIKNNVKYEVNISPSDPVFYAYKFNTNIVDIDDIKTVLILISSLDDICFTVSIQPQVCPVRDLNDDITYKGEYQTVNTKGGVTIPKRKFPDGFYLVLVAKGDNFDCSQENSLLPLPRPSTRIQQINQTSKVTFEIRPGLTPKSYISSVMLTLSANLVLTIFFFALTYIFYYFGRYRDVEEPDEIENRMEGRILALSLDEYDSYYEKADLKVSDFVKKGRINNAKALNYFWHITNIGIFYGIPVVQLMISYQRAVNTSGNLDMCYHNFHCSHPMYFTDFNHIFSNIGYVMFGILFLFITLFRNKKMHNFPNCGVPKFHGLYYSMGFALVFEGILSACYHICPNQMNFQFDTSFMYVMAVLIMIKLYQNRHPDINASAYGTFGVVGIAVFVAMFGILYNSMAIMLIFILSYITLCFYLGFKIYFFGHVVRGLGLIYKGFKNGDPIVHVLKPVRIGRFILLLIANLCNFCIAITGMVLYPKHVDFGTFLLGILMINAIIYAIFYMTMKLVLKEKICIEAIVYGILAMIFWAAGGYFFLDASTLWSVTPAESRQLNKECIVMGFFDTHDVWHLISAPALFFSFMFLLSLDDDLFNTPQSDIYAF